MPEIDPLTARFEAERSKLRALAYRMLSSRSEADDALQEAWLRVARADASSVENLGGWLTTVVARVCLDMLRARKSRHEEPEAPYESAAVSEQHQAPSPEHGHVLADSVSLALLVVLETLKPAERLAFVLHDLFDLPFEEIAGIAGCSPAAARQLASRARRRVRGAASESEADAASDLDVSARREVVDAFLYAARYGDLTGLLAVLDPNVVLRADPVVVQVSAAARAPGAPRFSAEIRGSSAVAQTFSGRAQTARPAQIDGLPGAVWAPGGSPRVVFDFSIEAGKIVAIDVIADPNSLRRLEVEMFEA